MADIELVIKIPEELHKDIKEYGLCGHSSDREIVSEAIANGKPLKAGHWVRVAGGSLIDDYRCDCCNHQPPVKKVGLTWGWDFTDFCPTCGADMKAKESE